MPNLLAQQAVQAALHGQWEEAKKINEEILQREEKDQEALCRLARACLELGKPKKSLSFYKKALTLDPYNTVAQKAVDRLRKLKESGVSHTTNHNSSTKGGLQPAVAFLEEPGKTKTATLIHLGAEALLTSLNIGDPIKLLPHAHRVSVETESGDFIGRLPDDLSARIIKFAKAGNEYEAFVRSVTSTQVRIFIRESKRGDNVQDIPSFPQTEKTNYVSFTPPDLVHDERPAMETLEEELVE
ncbi:MAG: hypothetical protein A2700_00980 [Candidatus Blackburnbacteria bacterium RIFCSPHIGHO2_01_FULL_44_64]|uniref:Uncharacterized protein n=2 Tax=Microgenomates group TaxID=1794810 RepID=A0A0G1VRM6_9BACT|nr:MAG: hypothetical protein UY08_C0008G0010 [Candidatus Gottesmanbacteria bacterium GW2011_GWA1_47_8]OGY08397.1 MAG: hypothetical protein A2700_00980 [Candidatus Blackburnbacteria bacterium RIFCSPHIGHO2_01_FULL_44_64]OGY10891.1 MAG: hypothetical protein A3E16_03215 [Candidatus Blackburnbacteria bacterium RIFCSPHIGHO2_12_FULL_44_25]OGY10917.1 MAG: hypothetical protein A3D26_01785 [Candidatus Blackburnbacteria bacterium RIFCSPHIGHO2_02_FULL_44_20]OGY13820.1 MAG: hypothetical protein A3A62_00690 